MSPRSAARSMVIRTQTMASLLTYFAQPQRVVLLVPMLLSVVVAGVLLLLTGGLSYVAPFVYSLF